MTGMARLIDADVLVAHFRRTKIDEVFPNWKELFPSTQAAILRLTTKYRAIVLSAPTVDAVEVVRCKDCKHRGDYGCPMYHEEYIEWDDDGYHESEIIDHDRTRDDGFCDLGERKEN